MRKKSKVYKSITKGCVDNAARAPIPQVLLLVPLLFLASVAQSVEQMDQKFKPHNLRGLYKAPNSNGYYVSYYPKHPYAWSGSGLVYYHRLVMENKLARYLDPSEVVHHKDDNPANNKVSNLKLVTSITHGTEHTKLKKINCLNCGIRFKPEKAKRRYCSHSCATFSRRKVNRPSKTKLKKLVWSKPASQVARDFGVSDVTIVNWCKKYGIKKPPRGYWS